MLDIGRRVNAYFTHDDNEAAPLPLDGGVLHHLRRVRARQGPPVARDRSHPMIDEPREEVLAQWHERQRNRSAEQELQDTVISAIWHAANRSLGMMQIATLCGNDCCIPGETVPAFDLDTWKAQKADGELQKRLHLEATRLAVLVGQDPRPWVLNARKVAGASWQEIADAVGLNSRQAAQQRFGQYVQWITEGSDYYAGKVAK